MKKSLAVIIPVYRSTESVKILTREIQKTFYAVCPYHIYLIDDGNQPKVTDFLIKQCLLDKTTLISLKRNYGQQNAVLCGLNHSIKYDYTAVMDDDLEHPVKTLYYMYRMMEKGYDLIYGIPDKEKKRAPGSRMRNFLFSAAFNCPKNKRVSSFRIMTNRVVKDVIKDPGSFFYFSAAALKKSRNIGNIIYSPPKNSYRKSGYNTVKRTKLFCKILWYYRLLPPSQKKSHSLYHIRAVYPRLMVLGGSNCQLHALERAASQDIFTVLADYTDNPPGALAANVHEKISTFDINACTLAAKKYHVQGIMTMGTDQPVYTAAKISETLSLPSCLTTKQALSVTNKKVMKRRMAMHNIPTAAWMLIDETTKEEELSRLKPPYVIKPIDSQGQRGIFKLHTKKEVLTHLKETLSYSRCKEALVEEYYESDEITVSGYIDSGELTVLTITDRLLYEDPVHIGVCIGHRFPSIYMSQYEEIRALSQKLTSIFELPAGPFYLQLLAGKKGLFVNELACRIGGAFEDVTIQWLTGFDILKAVMNASLSIPTDLENYKNFRCDRLNKAAAVQLMFCRPGRIQSITPADKLKELPYVADCGFNYKEGDEIPKMENATARFGHSVIIGTKDNIASHVNEFYKNINVLSEEGDNLLERMYPQ